MGACRRGGGRFRSRPDPIDPGREGRYGQFRRIIPLPAAVDEGEVEARYQDGVLTVTLPKTREAQPKKIEVKT